MWEPSWTGEYAFEIDRGPCAAVRELRAVFRRRRVLSQGGIQNSNRMPFGLRRTQSFFRSGVERVRDK